MSRTFEQFRALMLKALQDQEGFDFTLDGYEDAVRWAYETEGQIPLEDLVIMTKADPTWQELQWRCQRYPRIEALLCLE